MGKRVVYVLTSGSYSDKANAGVFSSKENAEEFIRAYPRIDWNELEEYELDTMLRRIRRGIIIYTVRMERDGKVTEVMPDPIPWSPVNSAYVLSYPSGYRILTGWIEAKDEKHAVKIVNDKRAQMIASGEWE
jgi:hypothetical protein